MLVTTEPEPPPPSPERQQTDESLRIEREKADAALAENLAVVDEIADAVIVRARLRADEVLAAARAKTDRKSPSAVAPPAVVKERGKEDKAVRAERADADEVLKEERAEHVAHLATERNETDQDLVRERDQADDALATRDDFLAIVSHDLRTLLNQVMGFAQLITMELDGKENVGQLGNNAERIQRSGARMNRLIGDLVDVASIQTGTLTVTRQEDDPARVLKEAVDTFQAQAQSRGISVLAEIASPGPLAMFDPSRVLQVLTNLLSNSLKFTPAKGKILARVERVDGQVQFTVTDTGKGIPADKLEAIFERYLQVESNDRRGVGLGLYISRCIVQGHGGRIWAESTVGKGSAFHFTLPLGTG